MIASVIGDILPVCDYNLNDANCFLDLIKVLSSTEERFKAQKELSKSIILALHKLSSNSEFCSKCLSLFEILSLANGTQ